MISIYRASAGAGKTFTLAREYIKFLLGEYNPETGRWRLARGGGNTHRSILGVTFTNKATEEMKKRIIHELAVIARMESGWEEIKGDYNDYLTATFGCSESQLQEAARRALTMLLNDFSYFQISTIDSFFQSVLRAFAREAELSGNFEVTLDNTGQISSATDKLLQSLKTETDPRVKNRLADWIFRLMMNKFSEGKKYDIFNRRGALFSNVVTFFKNITNEQFHQNRDEIIASIEGSPSRVQMFGQAVDRTARQWRADVASAAAAVNNRLHEIGLEVSDLSRNAFNLVNPWLINSGADYVFPDSAGKTVEKMCNDNCVEEAFTKAVQKKHPYILDDAPLSLAISNFAKAYVRLCNYRSFFSHASQNLYMLGLVNQIDAFMNDMLREANLMLISDTNSVLSGIIGTVGDDTAPFVYERIGTSLDHFLIDEFQDTSRMQWHNLHPLLHTALADGNESLIIGDEKQSIYGFRNSDPELLRTQISADLRLFLPTEDTPALDFNWRSSPVIVEFNNDLFNRLAASLGLSQWYGAVSQKVPKKNSTLPGYVSVTQLYKENPSSPVAFENPVYARCISEGNGTLYNMMANINRQLKAGYRPCDIVVLVRSATEGANVIDFIRNATLLNPEWPSLRIVSDDAMTIQSSPAVRSVIATMRQLATIPVEKKADPRHDSDKADSPGDKPIFQRAIMARFFKDFEQGVNSGMSESDSLQQAIARREEQRLNPSLKPHDNIAEISAIVDTLFCADLYSVTEAIIKQTINPRMAYAENVFLAALQDMVLEFSRSNNNDLREFLKWWDLTGVNQKVALPPDTEAIRVMTVHKSKGLEFPCVHIPYCFGAMVMFKDTIKWLDISGFAHQIGVNPDTLPRFFPFNMGTWMEKTFLAPQLKDFVDSSTLESLNVAYVAFTRAVRELIIGVNGNDKTGFYPTMCNLLGITDKNPFISFGEPTVPEKSVTSKPREVLSPEGSDPMPDYVAGVRNDLWRMTQLEEDEDISNGVN